MHIVHLFPGQRDCKQQFMDPRLQPRPFAITEAAASESAAEAPAQSEEPEYWAAAVQGRSASLAEPEQAYSDPATENSATQAYSDPVKAPAAHPECSAQDSEYSAADRAPSVAADSAQT
jgi:hypothetical protein